MNRMDRRDPDFYRHLRAELSDGRRWFDRSIVLAYAALAGVLVVTFTLMVDASFEYFKHLISFSPWIALVWTPALTVALAWATRRWFPRAAGSGIPQVIAALDPGLDAKQRKVFVSLRLSVAKMVLATGAFLAGLSVGREGPSVQVAAGVMAHASRWFSGRHVGISPHALLVAGGAAGIAAAFNAPLAGVVFAIEEMSRHMEARYSGVILAAIVLAGLIGVSMFGNVAYFGVIRVDALTWSTLAPSITVAVVAGLAGGVFARLLVASLTGTTVDRVTRWRQSHPLHFAAGLGLAIAVIGIVSGGQTYGGGTDAARELLHGRPENIPPFFALLKFVATWLSSWTGVPGGLFAPSLSVGAGIGYNVSSLFGDRLDVAVVAMGMAGYLAAVTQAPLTAFIIVMEMIDGRPLVLTLMGVAMVSAAISRTISRPLYHTLAAFMLAQFRATLPQPPAPPEPEPVPPPPAPIDDAAMTAAEATLAGAIATDEGHEPRPPRVTGDVPPAQAPPDGEPPGPAPGTDPPPSPLSPPGKA